MFTRLHPSRWWLPVLGAVLGGAAFWLVRDSLGDDIYITLSYARNLAVRGEWGLVPGITANSATSPLNVLTLAALTRASLLSGAPHAVAALGAQSVLAGALLGWAWSRLVRAARMPGWVGAVGLVGAATNPYVVSSLGLEVLLIPTALAWLVVAAVERRPVLYGIVAGLAVLVRLDLIVFVLVIAVAAGAIRRRLWLSAAVGVAVTVPWFAYSWVALGSFIPDTLVIKQAQRGLFGEWTFTTGLVRHFHSDPVRVVVAVAIAALGITLTLAWFGVRFARRWDSFGVPSAFAALGCGAIGYYVAYSLLGVGPYSWYYVAPITGLTMAAVLLLGRWYALARGSDDLSVRVPLAALCACAVLAAAGIAIDVRPGVPWPSSRVTGNWASAAEYARIGRAVGERVGDAGVSGPGEIGTLSYFCECRIYDRFSDRGRTAQTIRERLAGAGTVERALLEFNYRWLDLDQQPRPTEFMLRYASDHAKGPDVWNVSESTRGDGHFALVRADEAR
ncbi:hypothetical protein [Naumannella huperziae]